MLDNPFMGQGGFNGYGGAGGANMRQEDLDEILQG